MGAWGDGPFENDSALDWLSEAQSRGIEAVREVLERAAQSRPDDYLDVDDGAPAVAAAAVLAASVGHGQKEIPANVRGWVASIGPEVTAADRALARRALERVLGSNSEVASLRGEQGESAWHRSTRALADSLT